MRRTRRVSRRWQRASLLISDAARARRQARSRFRPESGQDGPEWLTPRNTMVDFRLTAGVAYTWRRDCGALAASR